MEISDAGEDDSDPGVGLTVQFLKTTDWSSLLQILSEKKEETITNLLVENIDFVKLERCLKITEKVSFNIASEASYVYILSGQKLIKNA